MPKGQKANPEDAEAQLWGSAVQLGLRLTGRHSHMLGLVRDWLAKQSLIEYEGHSSSGPEAAKTDTTLARFILESAIENLYADYELDKLIDHAAELWSKETYEFGEDYPADLNDAEVQRQLMYGSKEKSGIGTGYPNELIERVVGLGQERWRRKGAGQGSSLVDGQKLMDRVNKSYPESPDDNKQEIVPF